MNTPNLDLNILVATDTPSWLTDFDANMDKIDEFAGNQVTKNESIDKKIDLLESHDDLVDGQVTSLQGRMTSVESKNTEQDNLLGLAGQDVANIKNDLITQNTAIKQVQTDVSKLKDETSSLKTDTAQLKTEMSDVMGDIASVQADLTQLDNKVNNYSDRITAIDQKATSAIDTAENAELSAQSASQTATNAYNTANTAKTAADNAQSTADDAYNKGNLAYQAIKDCITCVNKTVNRNVSGTQIITRHGSNGMLIITAVAKDGTLFYQPLTLPVTSMDGVSTINFNFYLNEYEQGGTDTTPQPKIRVRNTSNTAITVYFDEHAAEATPVRYNMLLIEDIAL